MRQKLQTIYGSKNCHILAFQRPDEGRGRQSAGQRNYLDTVSEATLCISSTSPVSIQTSSLTESIWLSHCERWFKMSFDKKPVPEHFHLYAHELLKR